MIGDSRDMITAAWISPEGEEMAVQFADGTIGIESRGGSRSGGRTPPTHWTLVYGTPQ
jgi:hypothetical protein